MSTTPSEPGGSPALDAVMTERRQLINIAYRLLGSLAEAEDVVQDTYTRWYAMSRSQQQAIEFAALGIRVNAVAPGPVDTAMAKSVHTPDIRAAYHDAIPLNRYGLETELAEAIFFLCSDRASYITGQTLAVDGGFEATGIGLPALRASGRNG